MLGELPGPPTGANPGSSPLHGHYPPSVTKHCVPSLANEPGSAYASPRVSYAAGGDCYPAMGLHVPSLLCRPLAQAALASAQALSSVTCHHH